MVPALFFSTLPRPFPPPSFLHPTLVLAPFVVIDPLPRTSPCLPLSLRPGLAEFFFAGKTDPTERLHSTDHTEISSFPSLFFPSNPK